MADVHCSTCFEPYDTYHLKFDEVHECDIAYEEAKSWIELQSWEDKLNERYRGKFGENGWEFGSTVLNVKRCPACPKDSVINSEADEAKEMLESILGDDLDAMETVMEDYRL